MEEKQTCTACLQTHAPVDTNTHYVNVWRTCEHLSAVDWLHCIEVKLTSSLDEAGWKLNRRYLQSSDEQRDSGEFGRRMAAPAAAFKSRWRAKGQPFWTGTSFSTTTTDKSPSKMGRQI